jgi:hypothetical protein
MKMNRERNSPGIYKLHIGRTLGLEDVEKVLERISFEVMEKAVRTLGFKLARIDLLKDETVVFFSGDKKIATELKSVFRKTYDKCKVSLRVSSVSDLAKAPKKNAHFGKRMLQN